jgi:hypothetical protein
MNQQIKIIGKGKNPNLYFCEYNPKLDKAIKNFQVAKTVKVIKGTCFIKNVSLAFFCELLSWDKIPYSVITTIYPLK